MNQSNGRKKEKNIDSPAGIKDQAIQKFHRKITNKSAQKSGKKHLTNVNKNFF